MASWSRRKTRIEKKKVPRVTNEAAFSVPLPARACERALSRPCSSPPVGLFFLRCRDAQRSSASRGATSGCGASCCGAAQPLRSSLLPCAPFTHRWPLRHRPASTSPLTRLLQVSQKSDYESRNGSKLSTRTKARGFADTEGVCTERSMSLDLFWPSDDCRGAR